MTDRCTYPQCHCPISFPIGYRPGVAECPRAAATDRIAELERQNADLQEANNRYLERARAAEAALAARPEPT